ncbi:MAG: hypothetical protein IPL63_10720 [Saprospiraceae bacterium]|nr:hypothetical protein [Saprospiraceae bacterium]
MLACNNYEIFDLGVMVAADKILDKALEYNVDVIGLSGLITPSLDDGACGIGNATKKFKSSTFKKKKKKKGGCNDFENPHCFKIEPVYSGPVIHVLDASRSVGVVSQLLGSERALLIEETKNLFTKISGFKGLKITWRKNMYLLKKQEK